MDNIVLQKGSRMLLYGAASFGTILYEKLKQSDFIVEGFIDQRADEIPELKGKAVYSIQEAAFRFSDADVIVVISVKNVFEHTKIAAKLFESGLKQIIYKPYAVLNNKGTEEENIISRIYDDFLQEEFNYGISVKTIKHPGQSGRASCRDRVSINV